ncbi:Cell surface GPI-anchored protein [Drechslerella dactyloides]|uniref:Cell surface GPI-anchored protein n=1 Tax=Drechslerella dactyloides TaxID=74499 RepID=A0AAD6NHV3_DREDA|nr:Cell surface GPI-anchored protein [Drechslerella dactyloides]
MRLRVKKSIYGASIVVTQTPLSHVVRLPLLSIIGPVYAQIAPVCKGSRTLNSQAELDRLSACVTFEGHLTLGPDFTSAQISGIQTIRGNLTAVNQTKLESLIAPNLSYVDGALIVTDAPNLISLSIPNLAYLGSIYLEDLPALPFVNTKQQIYPASSQFSQDIVIQRTGLETIGWIQFKSVSNARIIDNPQMNLIYLSLVSCQGTLEVRNNSQHASVIFSELRNAGNILIQDGVEKIDMPGLMGLQGSMILSNNTYSTLEFPNLTNVGEQVEDGGNYRYPYHFDMVPQIVIDSSMNHNLHNVSFPKLEWIYHHLIIKGSNSWTDLSGFPALQTVGRNITIDGDFTNIDFPQLKGWSNLTELTVNAPVSCNDFVHQKGIAHNNFTKLECNGVKYNTKTNTSGPASLGDGTDPEAEPERKMSDGAKAGVVVGVASAIGLAASAVLYYLRRNGCQWPWSHPPNRPISELPEAESSKAELYDDRMRPELGDGMPMAELEDGRMRPELEGSSSFIAELDGTPKLSPTTSDLTVFESTIPEIGEGRIR